MHEADSFFSVRVFFAFYRVLVGKKVYIYPVLQMYDERNDSRNTKKLIAHLFQDIFITVMQNLCCCVLYIMYLIC